MMASSRGGKKSSIQNDKDYNLLNSLPVSCFILTKDGVIVNVNNAALGILKSHRESVINKPFSVFVTENFKKIFNTYREQAIDTKENQSCELELVRADNERFFAELRCSVFTEKPDGPLFYIMAITDISARKEAEDALKESDWKYREFVDFLPQIVFEIDASYRFTFANKTGLDSTGFTQEDIEKGVTALDLVAAVDHQRMKKNIERTFKGESISGSEYLLIRKDGTTFPVIIYSAPIFKKGKPAGIRGIAIDNTAGKKAQQALLESEEKYRTLVEQLPVGLLIVKGTPPEIVFVNPAFARISGLSTTEAMSLSEEEMYSHISTKYSKLLMERYMQFISDEDREPSLLEFKAVRKDNIERWVEVAGAHIKYFGEHAIQIIMTDITDRKRAEEALRESEERFRGIAERSFDAIFETDEAGVINYISPSIERIIGLKPDNLKDESFFELLPQSQLRKTRRAYLSLKKNMNVEGLVIELSNSDGHQTVIEINASPIIKDGNFAGSQGAIRDITYRKMVEDALFAEKERLAVTLRSIGDGVITTDIKGNIVLINKVAEHLTGWTQEVVQGRNLNEVFKIFNHKTGEACENPVDIVLKTGKLANLINNMVLISRNGIERMIADSAAPIFYKDSKIIGAVLVFRDITEEISIKEELQRTNKLESIGILAGGIAHDFNNILAAILGNISLAKVLTYENKKAYYKLTEAEKAVERAKDLTQQLLIFSKGGTPIKKQACVSELLEDTVKFMLSGTNVRCELKIPEDLWSVEIDTGQMSQVINNLIINAQQAMPSGGVIEAKAENVSIKEENALITTPGDYIKVSIRDHGEGIPEEHFDKIFDPYFTTKPKGSGLGLAIVYSIIKKHNGFIDFESKRGLGTTFYLYLPAVRDKKLALVDSDHKPVTGKGKILFMDDESMICETAKDILEYLGYKVEIAQNGATVVEKYKKAMNDREPFNAVILDLTVPGGLGGRETAGILSEIDPDVKAIAFSGYSTDPVLANYRDFYFTDILLKPFTVKELSSVVHNVLNKGQSEQED